MSVTHCSPGFVDTEKRVDQLQIFSCRGSRHPPWTWYGERKGTCWGEINLFFSAGTHHQIRVMPIDSRCSDFNVMWVSNFYLIFLTDVLFMYSNFISTQEIAHLLGLGILCYILCFNIFFYFVTGVIQHITDVCIYTDGCNDYETEVVCYPAALSGCCGPCLPKGMSPTICKSLM